MVIEYMIPKSRARLRNTEETALDVAFKKRLRGIRRRHRDHLEEDPNSGVVYLSNIPRHFCEYAMFKYFTQFGRIKRIRLSRSKKSANSKGFAYIEFEYADVAKIVAETTNNYLMYRKLIKCKVVPKEELHPMTFKGCFRKFRKSSGRMNSIRRNNSYVTADTTRVCRTLQRRARQENKKEKLLKEMGIDFKIDGYGTEWEAVQHLVPKTGKNKKTEKGDSGGDDKVESKVTEKKILTENVVEEARSKETEEMSSADVSEKSPRRTRSKGRKAMPVNSKPTKEDATEKISGDTVEKEEQRSKEVKESLPTDVVKGSPWRKRTRKGARDASTPEVSRSTTPRVMKKRGTAPKVGQVKTSKKDNVTSKKRKSPKK